MSRPLTICLPIADRPRSFEFCRGGLGFEAVGALADDDVPEPLQVILGDGMHRAARDRQRGRRGQ